MISDADRRVVGGILFCGEFSNGLQGYVLSRVRKEGWGHPPRDSALLDGFLLELTHFIGVDDFVVAAGNVATGHVLELFSSL